METLPAPPLIAGLRLGAHGGLLKSRQSKRFVERDLDLAVLQKQTPTDRLRDLDLIRLYTPLPDERRELRIPESIQRLNLNSAHHLMLLCGGCALVRFSCDEMTSIMTMAKALHNCFNVVEECFKRLSSHSKKCIIGKEGSFTRVDEAALDFHNKADKYTELLLDLQRLVRSKVNKIIPAKVGYEEVMIFEADPEASSSSKSKPVWLQLLLERFFAEAYSSQKASSQQYSHVSLGKLSCFLSCCVSLQFSLTCDEELALLEVMHIYFFNSFHPLNHSEWPQLVHASVSYDSPDSVEVNDIATQRLHLTQRCWAKRFYEFLRKLPELKSAIRDEKSLYDFRNCFNTS